MAPCHGSRIHPCGGAAVRGQLAYISSSESAVNVIIRNISVIFCIMYVLLINNVPKQCVRLLYKYNRNIEENEVGSDSRQGPF